MGVKDEELEAFETLSLSDFPTTNDHNSGDIQDHHNNPPSPATDQDCFEFYRGGSSNGLSENHMMMSHAEDMISGGKLIPINNQPPPKTIPQHQNHNQDKQIDRYRGRCESMRELKSTKGNVIFRNSHSLDHKKLNRNPKPTHEPTDINRNSLSNRSTSSRFVFGPLKVPSEMDLRDIRNRQIAQKNNASDRFPGGDNRKTSWGVIGLLSCKRSGSVAVTMPLS
ncbi:hypothetical protein SSX86_002938 [Deinandra increscens subsp. villosa]|uniref:Uncharacterized protein n=1 Tax=Deinandra increscens subsp. villosa TaxID=3103831 RepID=A0AAP0DPN1_9ASTR